MNDKAPKNPLSDSTVALRRAPLPASNRGHQMNPQSGVIRSDSLCGGCDPSGVDCPLTVGTDRLPDSREKQS